MFSCFDCILAGATKIWLICCSLNPRLLTHWQSWRIQNGMTDAILLERNHSDITTTQNKRYILFCNIICVRQKMSDIMIVNTKKLSRASFKRATIIFPNICFAWFCVNGEMDKWFSGYTAQTGIKTIKLSYYQILLQHAILLQSLTSLMFLTRNVIIQGCINRGSQTQFFDEWHYSKKVAA